MRIYLNKMIEVNQEKLESLTLSDLTGLYHFYRNLDKRMKKLPEKFKDNTFKFKLVVLEMEIERRANNIFIK